MSYTTMPTQDGQKFEAYIAIPDQTPAPVIIVIQEIFGVNQNLKDKCDELAQEGFIALCPDLFWRIEPHVNLTDQSEEEWAQAFELYQAFDLDQGVRDLDDVLTYARTMDGSTGVVSCIGYCLGGKLSYLMATRTSVECAIGYYGVEIEKHLKEALNISKPLMLHMAEEDEYVGKKAQKEINTALSDHSLVTLHTCPDMNHAFTRIGGAHYDEKSAAIAHKRTIDFLKEHHG